MTIITLPKLSFSHLLFLTYIIHRATVGSVSAKHMPTVTQLIVYWHDLVSGPNPTSMRILPPLNPNKTGIFGAVVMTDNKLTEGPSPTSQLLGRSQGFYAGASLDAKDPALLMVMNFYFVSGEFNGSTIAIQGRNPVLHPVRELSVVGGTGVFRFATGFAEASTVNWNVKTGDATVRYNLTVRHFLT